MSLWLAQYPLVQTLRYLTLERRIIRKLELDPSGTRITRCGVGVLDRENLNIYTHSVEMFLFVFRMRHANGQIVAFISTGRAIFRQLNSAVLMPFAYPPPAAPEQRYFSTESSHGEAGEVQRYCETQRKLESWMLTQFG